MTEGVPSPGSGLATPGHHDSHLRKHRGLTQRALAARVGLTGTYVSAIERGRRNMTMWTLLHIAAALQVPLSTVLQPLEQSS